MEGLRQRPLGTSGWTDKDGARRRGFINEDVPLNVKLKSTDRQTSSTPPPNGTQHLLLALAFLLSLSWTVLVVDKILPEPQLVNNEGMFPERFVAERARDHVVQLTSMGPRVAGSHANEVLAVEYLKFTIAEMQKSASSNHRMEVDVTRHSGNFSLKFFDGMTHVYKNVQNVVVRLGPRRTCEHSLLLNCHFDSFVESPGGSDDAAGCAVMLEVLRIMSQSWQFLNYNVIFLFNGAEENVLQASHGFITQHPWAKDVKAFINLEACGAGGRELLFQAGPGNPWIIQVYSKVVPYPYASSLAQEIFQSGIVPGETDFRIFRDFGNISGLDFAWSKNGYVYHTRYDNVDQIPLGSLQRTGDNILALTRSLATGPHLAYARDQAASHESFVFFDFLGAFVVQWPFHVALLVNVASIVLGLYSIHLNAQSVTKESTRSQYIKQIALCAMFIIGSWIVALIPATAIALLLTKLGKAMSWYARPAWIFFLYICPSVAVSMAYFLQVGKQQLKKIESPLTLFRLYYDAYNSLCMLVLVLCIVFQIRSGFITMHWVFFPSLGNIFRHFFFPNLQGWKWLFYHLGILTLPYVQSFYLTIGALNLFVPLMGRAGALINSELLIGNLVTIIFCLLLSFTLPMVLLTKNAERVISVVVGIFLIALAVLILTPLGFPYSGNPASLAPQRFLIVHTQRQYFNVDKTLRYSGSGFWLIDLDMNSPNSVGPAVPEIGAAISTSEDCRRELYCGLPYLLPAMTFLAKTSWIPSPAPNIPIPTTLDLLNKSMDKDVLSLTFNVTGPDHMGMFLSPYENVKLLRWSILNEKPLQGPMWNGRETYFTYYACASDCEPFIFTIELLMPQNHQGEYLSLALAGHFMHGEHQKSAQLERFVGQFPAWTVITPWTASYTSWEF